VTGNINNGYRFIEISETKIDGHASGLLFIEAVGVGSGKRFHKGRFPMINMPRRSNDKLAHGLHLVDGVCDCGVLSGKNGF
jgi:hypothetical protein